MTASASMTLDQVRSLLTSLDGTFGTPDYLCFADTNLPGEDPTAVLISYGPHAWSEAEYLLRSPTWHTKDTHATTSILSSAQVFGEFKINNLLAYADAEYTIEARHSGSFLAAPASSWAHPDRDVSAMTVLQALTGRQRNQLVRELAWGLGKLEKLRSFNTAGRIQAKPGLPDQWMTTPDPPQQPIEIEVAPFTIAGREATTLADCFAAHTGQGAGWPQLEAVCTEMEAAGWFIAYANEPNVLTFSGLTPGNIMTSTGAFGDEPEQYGVLSGVVGWNKPETFVLSLPQVLARTPPRWAWEDAGEDRVAAERAYWAAAGFSEDVRGHWIQRLWGFYWRGVEGGGDVEKVEKFVRDWREFRGRESEKGEGGELKL